jgi:hypothetical protein
VINKEKTDHRRGKREEKKVLETNIKISTLSGLQEDIYEFSNKSF